MGEKEERELIMIYNASSTILGEIQYLISSTFWPSTNSCGACQLTHSFCELGEKKEWKMFKHDLWEQYRIQVRQLHTNELPADLQTWFNATTETPYSLPILLLSKSKAQYEILMDRDQLSKYQGNIEAFSVDLKQALSAQFKDDADSDVSTAKSWWIKDA